MAPLTYLARICWNTRRWTSPAGVAHLAESGGSHASTAGFGHEEWLFDTSRCLDGWHYAYLTPVMRSRSRLLNEDERVLSILLWTKDPSRRDWYAGTIHHCEILDDGQASHAFSEYQRRGWLSEMAQEVEGVGCAAGTLKAPTSAWIFNVRFRPDEAELFDPLRPILPGDAGPPAYYYTLYRAQRGHARQWNRRAPRIEPKATSSSVRQAIKSALITREHDALQNHITAVLREHYGRAAVVTEADWVDVRCDDGQHLHYIEVKSAPSARAALREAIGQLLEYTYYDKTIRDQVPRLHVMAPGALTQEDCSYLAALETRVGLRLQYHQVTRETQRINLGGQ